MVFEVVEKSLGVEIGVRCFWVLRANTIGGWFEERQCLNCNKMKEMNS